MSGTQLVLRNVYPLLLLTTIGKDFPLQDPLVASISETCISHPHLHPQAHPQTEFYRHAPKQAARHLPHRHTPLLTNLTSDGFSSARLRYERGLLLAPASPATPLDLGIPVGPEAERQPRPAPVTRPRDPAGLRFLRIEFDAGSRQPCERTVSLNDGPPPRTEL